MKAVPLSGGWSGNKLRRLFGCFVLGTFTVKKQPAPPTAMKK